MKAVLITSSADDERQIKLISAGLAMGSQPTAKLATHFVVFIPQFAYQPARPSKFSSKLQNSQTMRLRYVLLMTAAMFLASYDSASAAADGVKVTVTESRSLRVHKPAEVDSTSEDDEERGLNWFGVKKSNDFARKNLDKMLKSKSFKNEMFSKWNGHAQDEIIKAMRPNKRKNSRFREMLLDYLNNVRPKPAQ